MMETLENAKRRVVKNAVIAVPNDSIHGIRHVEPSRPVRSMCLPEAERLLHWPKLEDVKIDAKTLPDAVRTKKHSHSGHISAPVPQTEKERLEVAEHKVTSLLFDTIISNISKKPTTTSTTLLVPKKRSSVTVIPSARTSQAQPIIRGSAFGFPPPPTKKPLTVTGKKGGDALSTDNIGSCGSSYSDQLVHAMYADFDAMASPPSHPSPPSVLALPQTPQPIHATADTTAVKTVGKKRVFVPESPL